VPLWSRSHPVPSTARHHDLHPLRQAVPQQRRRPRVPLLPPVGHPPTGAAEVIAGLVIWSLIVFVAGGLLVEAARLAVREWRR
jgi:hypothetical protein